MVSPGLKAASKSWQAVHSGELTQCGGHVGGHVTRAVGHVTWSHDLGVRGRQVLVVVDSWMFSWWGLKARMVHCSLITPVTVNRRCSLENDIMNWDYEYLIWFLDLELQHVESTSGITFLTGCLRKHQRYLALRLF